MRAQGIYINVSRRNEDVFEMLDDYTQMKDFEDQSTDIPQISHPFRDFPFPYIFPSTGHGIYGTLKERLGLLDPLNPYYNSIFFYFLDLYKLART